MLVRCTLSAAVASLALGLLDPAAALATVKCQCNNGSVAQAMDVDYDDENLDAACDDACSMLGGGRVWNFDTDRNDVVEEVPPRREPPREPLPASPGR